MRNLLIISAIFIICSCGNSTENNTGSSNNIDNTMDTTNLSNPIVIDTLKHPSGVDNSSVISTDTAAMNVQNTIKKADSVNKEKNK